MGTLNTRETQCAPSRRQPLGCADCLLHLEHHQLGDECLDYMIQFLDNEYDKPAFGVSRVERYFTEYETRLLGRFVEGSGECGVSKPSS